MEMFCHKFYYFEFQLGFHAICLQTIITANSHPNYVILFDDANAQWLPKFSCICFIAIVRFWISINDITQYEMKFECKILCFMVKTRKTRLYKRSNGYVHSCIIQTLHREFICLKNSENTLLSLAFRSFWVHNNFINLLFVVLVYTMAMVCRSTILFSVCNWFGLAKWKYSNVISSKMASTMNSAIVFWKILKQCTKLNLSDCLFKSLTILYLLWRATLFKPQNTFKQHTEWLFAYNSWILFLNHIWMLHFQLR